MRIFTFDTTLRDGTQGEAVSFSVDDKLAIAQKLDDLGIDYIEGGWPGPTRRTRSSSRAPATSKLKHAKLTAFGSTRLSATPSTRIPTFRPRRSRTPVVSIFGKSWDLHVHAR
jgi:2-isopropylmalate synthase